MKLPDTHPLIAKKHPLILAPMADITHAGFRTIIEEMGGCDLLFTEMISAGSLVSGGKYEPWYIEPAPAVEKTVAQLVGNQKQRLVEAAEILIEKGFRHIDLNMGCSAPDIIKRQQGGALLKDLSNTLETVEYMRNRLPENCYLSAKIRLGEKEDLPFLINLCQGLEERGLSFITLHPKTTKEKAARQARWYLIPEVMKHLEIPLIGNGGIQRAEQSIRMEESTGVKGIMIGRAAVQKPWIFREISALHNKKHNMAPLDLSLLARNFFRLTKEYQPRDFWFTRARRFSLYFHKNLRFGYRLHYRNIHNSRSLEDIESAYNRYFEDHPEEKNKMIVSIQT